MFGNDYDTADGTGVRDYIHSQDLVNSHAVPLKHCLESSSESLTLNLGTGKGNSVLEMVSAFERSSNTRINYEIASRCPDDIAACWADTLLAEQTLG